MIIIIEPRCTGDLHDMVNASFIYGICTEYHSEKVIFYADSSHQKCIKDIFSNDNLNPENLEFIPSDIPKGNFFNISKIFLFYRLFNHILSSASKLHVKKIFFLTIYSYNLIILKILLKYRYTDLFEIKIIVHGVLEDIRSPTSSFLLNRIKQFRYALMLFPELDIQYIVLSPSIMKNLIIHLPSLSKKFVAMHLPYLYKPKKKSFAQKKEKLVFATIGRGNPTSIKQVVTRIQYEKISHQSYEFLIVGESCDIIHSKSYRMFIVLTLDHLKKSVIKKRLIKNLFEIPVFIKNYFKPVQESEIQNLKCVSGGRRLSRSEIDHYMEFVDYTLFLYHKNLYKLSASGSFFDSISFRKPMIFLGNDFFDYYFSRYKIGYRAETIDEIIAIIKKIIETNNEEETYNQFLKEIDRFREEINIESELKRISSG